MYSISNSRRQGTRGPAIWPVLALLVLGLLFGARPAAAQDQGPSEYQVKAAFLFNFGKFVEWPSAQSGTPLVIGVYGGNPFHHDLEQLVANKQIGGRPVTVQQVTALDDLKKCQIVFLNSPNTKEAEKILGVLDHTPVLTVTENVTHFPESNFMINFVVDDNRIRFEINNDAARCCGMKISSKLLALAKPAK